MEFYSKDTSQKTYWEIQKHYAEPNDTFRLKINFENILMISSLKFQPVNLQSKKS